MRRTLLRIALAFSAVALFSGSADAQIFRRTWRSRPVYWTPTPVFPVAPVAPIQTWPAFSSPVVQAGFMPGGEAFIRSLYWQFLQREPDWQGMQTWLTRLNQLGGDTNRLTAEFAQSAAIERNANNPNFRLRSWP